MFITEQHADIQTRHYLASATDTSLAKAAALSVTSVD
jgi:hypothetical protein